MKKMKRFLKKNSLNFLTVASVAGVVSSVVLAVRATPKALVLIQEEKDKLDVKELSIQETIKVAWKPYIPVAISTFLTIVSILSMDRLSVKTQKSLMSAYVLLENSFNEYQKAVKNYIEENGLENFEKDIKKEVIKSVIQDDLYLSNDSDDEEEFFDYQSMRYFKSTFEKVKKAEQLFNDHLKFNGSACLNDYYDLIGLPHVDYGYQLGWDTYGYTGDLEFDYENININDDMEICVITMPYRPIFDYDLY